MGHIFAIKAQASVRPAAALLCAGMSLLAAQPAYARSDGQLWLSGGVNVSLSPDWRLSEEVIARFSDNRDGLYEIEATTLLGYKLSKNITIAGGYVHNPQYSNGKNTAIEGRAREQITFDNVAEIAGGKLSLRFRAEQRWRDTVDGTGWRIRPYAKYTRPLAGKVNLNLSHESFINLNETAFQSRSGYDRMRNMVSVSVPLSKKIGFEGGYMNQHGFVPNGPDNTDHAASLALTLSL